MKQIEKEFDERFLDKEKSCFKFPNNPKEIKQFYKTKTIELLEEVVGEIEKMNGEYLIRKQGVEGEGVYLNKLELMKELLDYIKELK